MYHFRKATYKMKYLLMVMTLLLTGIRTSGQIYMNDSTVYVTAYWDKGEKQKYFIQSENIKINGLDTTFSELTTYDVEITVLKSNSKAYTIQWLYKNLKSTNPNPTFQKLLNLKKDMKVIFQTDAVGIFVEVVNWKEIKDFIHQAIGSVQEDFKDIPEMSIVLKQIESTFSTKEAIESGSINDIQQFLTFHGAEYTLSEELVGQFKVTNFYSTELLDADYTVKLDEINNDEMTFMISASQEVNKEQLTNSYFEYLTTLAQNMKVEPPKREDIIDMESKTLTSSRIQSTGWVINSIQTTTVKTGSKTTVDVRRIEMN